MLPPKDIYQRWQQHLSPAQRRAAISGFLLLGLLWLVLCGGSYYGYRSVRATLEEQLEARMIKRGLALADSLTIKEFPQLDLRRDDGKLDIEVIRTFREDSTYKNLIALLNEWAAMTSMRSIHLVTPDGYIVVDPKEPYRLGEAWDLLLALDAPEIAAASAGTPSCTELYPVGDTYYKRAYVAVNGGRPNGGARPQAPALLRLEAGDDSLDLLTRQLRVALTVMLSISTGIVLLVGLVLWRMISLVIRAERQMSQENRLRSLGTLAAGLAHELRNPLAIIRLACEELKSASSAVMPALPQGGEDPAIHGALMQTTALLRDIQDEVRRMEQLVEQFLALARPEASQSVLRRAGFDGSLAKKGESIAAGSKAAAGGTPSTGRIGSRGGEIPALGVGAGPGSGGVAGSASGGKSVLTGSATAAAGGGPKSAADSGLQSLGADPLVVVRRVTRLFGKSLNPPAQQLRMQLPSAPVGRVALDEKALSQALINLLRNALEALRPEGGIITLTVEERPKKQLLLEVADTGTGMPEDVKRQVFDPFFTTKRGGTGLGLPVVRSFVEKVGGKIEIDSTPNKGTAIRLLIPIVAPPPKDKTPAVGTPVIETPIPISEASMAPITTPPNPQAK